MNVLASGTGKRARVEQAIAYYLCFEAGGL